jgi:type III restriction enzyme
MGAFIAYLSKAEGIQHFFALVGAATGVKLSQDTLFKEPADQKVALATLDAIKEFEQLPRSSDLRKPEIMQQLVERATERLKPAEPKLFEETEPEKIAEVVAKTVDYRNEMSIDIPRIVVVPKGEVEAGFRDFDLDVTGIHLQPVSQEILIAHLHDQSRHRLHGGDGVVAEGRPEDYLVRGLIEFDDIHYDSHAELLYKLAGQAVAHLRSYLNGDEVLNVLQAHQELLVGTIHAQMQAHYEEKADEYEVHISRGFRTLRPYNYSTLAAFFGSRPGAERRLAPGTFSQVSLPAAALACGKSYVGQNRQNPGCATVPV